MNHCCVPETNHTVNQLYSNINFEKLGKRKKKQKSSVFTEEDNRYYFGSNESNDKKLKMTLSCGINSENALQDYPKSQ